MNLITRIAGITVVCVIFAAAHVATSRAQDRETVAFMDASRAAGIVFPHENGRTPDKHLPETMGSGGLIFDYDRDGWPDVFLVNGGSLADESVAATARHHLYRNLQDGSFVETAREAGISTSGYGMGACAADYDADGWTDLYVTSMGRNSLYRNTGDGHFVDVTESAGVGSRLWSASCAFGDLDNDGDLDLYVTNYVDYSVTNNKYCRDADGARVYCHPQAYDGAPDVLYRNDRDGGFSDISREAGISSTAGKGLGVVLSDYDEDGLLDIYVANDSVANFLYHNLGDGRFEEAGMWAGVAVGTDGRPLAGMGTDIADVDADGLLDVFVTNLNRQTHNLYRNLGDGLFADSTFESGIGAATLPFVGFGTAFFDYDNDTDLDLAIANGDVLDHGTPGQAPQAQANLLLDNDGTGRFSPALAPGPGFDLVRVSRALVVGDLDNDGDLDIVVSNNGQEAEFLRNEGGNRNNSLLIRLEGSASNREGIGARLELHLGDRVLTRILTAGSSYLGQNDLRVHFGMGSAGRADSIEVRWPGGAVDRIEGIDANQIVTLTEGRGVTDARPFSR